MNRPVSTFNEFNENGPCRDCSAPCCKYLLIAHKAPSTWMDLDYIRYLLNFSKIKVTVSKKGEWGILMDLSCLQFDSENHNCKVHDTPEQPKTCSYYNPYQCLYKKNLLNIDKELRSIYTLDRNRFEHWIQFIKFDKNGSIVDAPSFEKSVEILEKFSCEHDGASTNMDE